MKYEINLDKYYYNAVYEDHFRIVKYNRGSTYPYEIEWFHKEVEDSNQVAEEWFDLPEVNMSVYATREIL